MKSRVLRLRDNWRPQDLEPVLAALRRDEVVIAPTDTVYGLVARAFSPKSFETLDRIKGNRQIPYAIVFDSVAGLKEWYGTTNPFRRRVIDELLPGPASLVLPPPDSLPTRLHFDSNGIAVRVCSDRLYPELARQLGEPLWATSANRSGDPAPTDFALIDLELFAQVSMAVDAGVTAFGAPSTVVNITRIPFHITRPGADWQRISGILNVADRPLQVLVVCTGNICRSPLMAGMMTSLLGEPAASGISVTSAGTHASEGHPATPYMVDIAAEWGFDLCSHRARIITREILLASDLILVAEPEHSSYIAILAPEVADRIHPAGRPAGLAAVPDPFGISREFYLQTADLIRVLSKLWVDELRAMVAEAGWTPQLQFRAVSAAT